MKLTAVWPAGAAFLIASIATAVVTQAPADAVPPGNNGKIAFNINDSGGIVVMNADGTGQVQITGDGQINPSWSPDASKIAFANAAAGSGSYEIFTMNADGTNFVQLTDDQVPDGYPAWSPDGTKIAWGRSGQIWVMNADGSNQVQLTDVGVIKPPPLEGGPPTFSAYGPAWSPDGSKIVYASYADYVPGSGIDFDYDYEIVTMNADGSDRQPLTNGPDWSRSPSWSPDGTKIVFDRRADGNASPDVWVMDADGTNPVNLTNHPLGDEEPVWSPDGTKIAYASNRAYETGPPQTVWVMNADGSNPVNLTPGVEADEPDWGRKPIMIPQPTVTPITPSATILPPKTVFPAGLAKCWGKAPTIVGTTGNDTIVGTEGPDVIAGLGGRDTIRGLGGNDRICGPGKIRIDGGDGDDRLQGSRGDDILKGGDGDDRVEGGRGDDRLEGGSGKDHLGGGPDTDRIKGGSGKDKLYGGSGTYDLCKGGRGYDKASKGCEKKTGIQDDIDD